MTKNVLITVKNKDNVEVELTKTDKLRLMSIESVRGQVASLKQEVIESTERGMFVSYDKYTPKGFIRFPIHQDNITYCVHPNGFVIDNKFEEVKYFKGEDGDIYIEAGGLKINLGHIMTNGFKFSIDIIDAFEEEVTMAGLQRVVKRDRIGKVFENVANENVRDYDLTLLYDNIVSVHLKDKK